MPERRKPRSYLAGEKGRNRVRLYEDRRDLEMYLEWSEPVLDEHGRRVRDKHGRLVVKKRRTHLESMSWDDAKTRADRCAAEFGELSPVASTSPSTASLMKLYIQERTPQKGESKQDHDRRARRVWHAFLDAQPEEERRSTRPGSSLDRIDWDRFIEWRREGKIPGFGPVRARQVAYDLKFMIAVLNWSLGRKRKDGSPFIARNPWAGDVRRAETWPMPKEVRPRRPGMSDQLRERLIPLGPWQFGLALRLGRLTVSRNSSVRHVRWSDVDLERAVIRWRAEFDKNDQEIEVPMPAEAVRALRAAPVRGIGDAWVFPSAKDPSKPTSRHTFQIWLRRAKAALLKSVENEDERERMRQQLAGVGYHSEKRAGVRDPNFRRMSIKAQESISRTSHVTLRNTYDDMSVEDLRREMNEAREA